MGVATPEVVVVWRYRCPREFLLLIMELLAAAAAAAAVAVLGNMRFSAAPLAAAAAAVAAVELGLQTHLPEAVELPITGTELRAAREHQQVLEAAAPAAAVPQAVAVTGALAERGGQAALLALTATLFTLPAVGLAEPLAAQ
jgi:hypothetical protein